MHAVNYIDESWMPVGSEIMAATHRAAQNGWFRFRSRKSGLPRWDPAFTLLRMRGWMRVSGNNPANQNPTAHTHATHAFYHSYQVHLRMLVQVCRQQVFSRQNQSSN